MAQNLLDFETLTLTVLFGLFLAFEGKMFTRFYMDE